MAVYSIIRVYEVPAETKQQATDRMMEALLFHVEKDFHVKDIIREPGAKPGQGKEVKLAPPAGWMTLLCNSSRENTIERLSLPPIQTWGEPQNLNGRELF